MMLETFYLQMNKGLYSYKIDTGEAEFNLLTEYKTQKDGTKVDGVLGFFTKEIKDVK